MSTKWDAPVSAEATATVTTDAIIVALDTGTAPLSRIEASVTQVLVDADVAWSGATRAWGVLGFGETQSWLVMPTGGRVVKVFRIVLVQETGGTVQLYEGIALNDPSNAPIDAELPLAAGTTYVERDRHPIWTTSIGTGLLVARGNVTTKLVYSVDFTIV